VNLSRPQWHVLGALFAMLSLICFGRVWYMMESNYQIAHTVYTDIPLEPKPGSTPADAQNPRSLEDRLRALRTGRETRRTIRKSWIEGLGDRRYDGRTFHHGFSAELSLPVHQCL